MGTLGKCCPACGKDIGLWPLLKLWWPNVGLKCPHCRTSLKYNPAGFGLFAVGVLIYLPTVIWAAILSNTLLADQPVLAFFAPIFLIWIIWLPFDLFMSFRIRKTSRLELK
jgi:hypothetical protein